MKLQINHITKKPYEGKNQAILMQESTKYKSNEWLTFLQAKQKGLKLVNAKGKGIHLKTFATDIEFNEQKEKDIDVIRPISFVVFNLDLTEKHEKQ